MTAELIQEVIDLAAQFSAASRRRDKNGERLILLRIMRDPALLDVLLRAGLHQFAFLRPETIQIPEEFEWWMEGREAA